MILQLKLFSIFIALQQLLALAAYADDSLIKSKELSRFIMESSQPEPGSTLSERHHSVSKKLDWAADVMVERSDIFISSSRYDDIADDQSYARRMLRRSIGKEASRLARSSEFKSFYNRATRKIKDAQEILTYKKNADSKNGAKDQGSIKILSLGFDSSNQLSPTVKVYEKLKVSYEPFSDRLLAEVGWNF